MRGFVSNSLERIRHVATGPGKSALVAVPPILGAALYSIFYRTPQQFFEESFPIAAFLTFISYGFFVMRWSLFGRPKFSLHLVLLLVLYLPVLIAAATMIYYGIWVSLRDSYVWFEHQYPPRSFFVAIIGVLVVVVGYALFLFRLRARFFFGLSEAVTGLIIALRNIPANADPALWGSEIFLVILTAGVFLVVRGFDNMHTGLKSEPPDSILRAFHETEYGALWRSLRGGNHESSQETPRK